MPLDNPFQQATSYAERAYFERLDAKLKHMNHFFITISIQLAVLGYVLNRVDINLLPWFLR